MTPEERAKARRLVDAATPGTSVAWISYALRLARKTGLDFADIEPDLTLNAATETDAELFAASRTLVPQLLDALEAAERERDGWTETAASFNRGMEYYRNLCDSTVPLFGNSIYVADDGTRSIEPLRAKIPELVTQHVKERDTTRARLAEIERGLGEQMAAHGAVYINIVVKLRAERDTARAQVETLAEALRKIGGSNCEAMCSYRESGNLCAVCLSRAALKAAGVET